MSSSRQVSDVLSEWAGVFMHRSMRDVADLMRSSGLSMAQVSTLFRLYYRGNSGVSDIAGHLGVSNAAASQMVERLVRHGLVVRSEDPSDRRARRIGLTAPGRALIQESIAARRRWMEGLTAELTPAEQDRVATVLSMLAEAARRSDSVEMASPAAR